MSEQEKDNIQEGVKEVDKKKRTLDRNSDARRKFERFCSFILILIDILSLNWLQFVFFH